MGLDLEHEALVSLSSNRSEGTGDSFLFLRPGMGTSDRPHFKSKSAPEIPAMIWARLWASAAYCLLDWAGKFSPTSRILPAAVEMLITEWNSIKSEPESLS